MVLKGGGGLVPCLPPQLVTPVVLHSVDVGVRVGMGVGVKPSVGATAGGFSVSSKLVEPVGTATAR